MAERRIGAPVVAGIGLVGADLLLACVLALLAMLALVILIGPVVVVLLTSFSTSTALRFPPPGLTLHWYAELLNPVSSAFIHAAALHSLIVAAASSCLAAALATSAALALARAGGRAARIADSLFMAPLLLPGIAFGLAALMFVAWLGLPNSLLLIALGHTVVIAPFVLRTAGASVAHLDPALFEASDSLGASRWFAFRRVVFPLIRPGVLAGTFLAFIASLDNVPVSLFLGSARTDMLPIRMWGMMESTLDVRVAAVSGLLVLFAIVVLLVMERAIGFARQLAQ
ncbi:MAG: ABC transporter permease subunit [Acetobacteraceae bacterium]